MLKERAECLREAGQVLYEVCSKRESKSSDNLLILNRGSRNTSARLQTALKKPTTLQQALSTFWLAIFLAFEMKFHSRSGRLYDC